MGKDNFKVIAKDDHSPIWSKGKTYEFKNGTTIWDNNCESIYYSDVLDFMKYNALHFEEYREELKQSTKEKSYTISDILLTDKFKDGQKFKFKMSEDTKYFYENVVLLTNSTHDRYLCWESDKKIINLNSYNLQAEYYPIQEKQYIETKAALELIQKGKEVYCEVDDNAIKFNNPNTKKIQIDYILNGLFYIMK